MQPQVISVTDFVGIINETLSFAYPQVIIEGEVSSFKINQGKWVFFDLKDDANVINCFMTVHQLKLPLEDGMKVRVTGSPKITKYSKFSFTVRAVEIAGEGALRRAMELLRAKLEAEGLFDPARKRPLPMYPRTIGLITSATSAAYADFIKILGARWGGLDVRVADVTVQGPSAPDQVVAALEYFNSSTPVDVVVLIRGGGSLEDLAAFSTEPVARAVAASRAPIIVGVGHEIDFSLSDYAADVRAATPTDAARLVVPDRVELTARVHELSRRTSSALDAALDRHKLGIDRAVTRLEAYLRYPRQQLDAKVTSLWRALDRLSAQPKQFRARTEAMEYKLSTFERQLLPQKQAQLTSLRRVLQGFNPEATLQRGYAIVRHDSTIVRDAATLKNGDRLVVQLAKGSTDTEVISKP
ncbi:exodeoxyribonuclease VII large subunit [Candidatus Saccharibacteria bacterium]|nr:exodeoxyribonuclease VII large subunit [Candidatus Saccharibacteria bacterium]